MQNQVIYDKDTLLLFSSHVPFPFCCSPVTPCMFCYMTVPPLCTRPRSSQLSHQKFMRKQVMGKRLDPPEAKRQQWERITLTPVANSEGNEPQLSPGVLSISGMSLTSVSSHTDYDVGFDNFPLKRCKVFGRRNLEVNQAWFLL